MDSASAKPQHTFLNHIVEILIWHGCRNVSADLLRHAKENTIDVEGKTSKLFWQTLGHLCSRAYSASLETLPFWSYECETKLIVQFCQCLLLQKGFTRQQFHCLQWPADNDESREVLIALAWVIADGNIFDTYWRNSFAEAGLFYPKGSIELPNWPFPSDFDDLPYMKNLQIDTVTKHLREVKVADFPKGSLVDCAKWHTNELLSLYGHLESLLGEIELLECGRVRLLKQINSKVQSNIGINKLNKQSKELTPLEICMMVSPELQKEMLVNLKNINSVIQKRLDTRELESKWWKWMKSVASLAAENKPRELSYGSLERVLLDMSISTGPVISAHLKHAAESFGGLEGLQDATKRSVGRKEEEDMARISNRFTKIVEDVVSRAIDEGLEPLLTCHLKSMETSKSHNEHDTSEKIPAEKQSLSSQRQKIDRKMHRIMDECEDAMIHRVHWL